MFQAGSSRKKRAPISAQSMIARGFALLIAIVTGLLMLPVSSQSRMWTDPLTALFTATSAVCVTGLVVVDTATCRNTPAGTGDRNIDLIFE